MMVVGISAVGAVTAVGEDAPGTVGSIFTGAQAFKRLPVDLPDGRPSAGAVTPISSDVKGADRIAMLTTMALKEATRGVVPETEIGLVLCTPFEGSDVEVDGRGGQFLKRVACEAGVLVDEKACRMVPAGLSGLVEAVRFAENALYSRDLAAVCLVAADSLSTQPRLGRLLRGEGWQRDRPIPGEAGAALLLTRQIGSGSLAILAGLGVGDTSAVTTNRPTATAKRSLAAIEAAMADVELSGEAPVALVHDLPPSQAGSEELLWLQSTAPFFTDPDTLVLSPSSSVGETGAVGGVLSLVTLAFLIGQAGVDGPGVCLFAGDGDQRAAALVVPPPKRKPAR
jgi:hypothetical protein